MTGGERWIPLYELHADAKCAFCWREILRRLPRHLVATRLVAAPRDGKSPPIVAWWSPSRLVFECPGCRTEGFRAEDARADEDRARAAAAGDDAQSEAA